MGERRSGGEGGKGEREEGMGEREEGMGGEAPGQDSCERPWPLGMALSPAVACTLSLAVPSFRNSRLCLSLPSSWQESVSGLRSR